MSKYSALYNHPVNSLEYNEMCISADNAIEQSITLGSLMFAYSVTLSLLNLGFESTVPNAVDACIGDVPMILGLTALGATLPFGKYFGDYEGDIE